ncbi:MAG: MetQ/NlpA family ABC transporter substrate-binding protein, partial [Synergistaceae bacterium]|nr:MetQ/NlpA family ABC transporter substrate-binding protein [Synergistaceae bacterium]
MAKKLFVALVLVIALAFSACAEVTVRLGVTGSVYDEMWQPAKEILAKQGINLEVIQFTDYVTPNRALDDGD